MAISLGKPKSTYGFADMPVHMMYQNYIRLWISNNSYNANNATFWERADRAGAYTNNASQTADTYETLVDVTGRGYMSCIITKCLGTNTATWTTKVTIDGIAVERTLNPGWVDRTDTVLYFGAPSRAAFEDTGSWGNMSRGRYNSPWDMWSSTYDVDNVQATNGKYIGVIPTDICVNAGLPVVSFKDSLKVETKQSATGPGVGFPARQFCGYMTLEDD